MKQVLILAAFLSSSAAMADDPPGIVWEKTYGDFTRFHAICAMQDGTWMAAGSGAAGDFCRIDGTGNVIQAIELPFTYSDIYAIEPLPDGGAIATGWAGSTWDLLVVRLTSAGEIAWTRLYGLTYKNETGRDVEPLSDGGYAVCGYREQDGLQNQAWILRMDSSGDTLWTRTLGEANNDYAFGVESSSDGIAVACTARLTSPSSWGVLACYDLNGELLCLHTYSQIPSHHGLCDVCQGPDNGFMVITQYFYLDNYIVCLDQSCQYLWEQVSPENAFNRSWRVRPTADHGCVIARQNDYYYNPDPPYDHDDWNAALSRYDSEGNELWSLSLERPDSCFFHDVTQLPTGGYIAAGRIRTPAESGYIVRFSPETGIEKPVVPSGLILEACVPNPATGGFDLAWSSGLAETSAMRVYDVSGRLRLDRDLGLMPAGRHSTQIDLQDLPSGCYLVVVSCGSERASTRLIKLP